MAFLGATLGAGLWASPTAILLSWVLMTTILGLMVIYGGTRATAVVKATIWFSSVVLLGFCLVGALGLAIFLAVPWPWPLALLLLPVVWTTVASLSSRHPASFIGRFEGMNV